MITIDLKLPPYLKTYLTTVYGKDYTIGTTDALGLLILNVLKKKVYYYKHSVDDNRTAVYKLHISLSMFEKYGCTISEEQLTQVVKIIDSDFRKSMYTLAVISREYQGIAYKDSITYFLNSFNISEDELSYSTIRRDFNRKKTQLYERLNLVGQK